MSIVSDIDFNVNQALKKLDALETKVDRSFKRQSGEVDKASKKMDSSFGNAMRRMAVSVGAFLSVAGFGRLIKQVYDVATAAEESGAKFVTIFQGMSERVDQSVNRILAKTNLLRREGRDAAAVFGGIAIAAGASVEDAAEMAETALALAADIASQQNAALDGPEGVINAIRGGLTGEAEQLKRFNVLLRAAAADTTALALSGKQSASQLTEWERVQGRFNEILKQSNVQMGDLDRTFGSTANTARRVQGSFRRAGEEMAQQFLPLLGDIIRATEQVTGADFAGSAARLTNKYLVTPIRVFIQESKTLRDEISNAADWFVVSWQIAAQKFKILLKDAFLNVMDTPVTNGFFRTMLKASGLFTDTTLDAIAAGINAKIEENLASVEELVPLEEERNRILDERTKILADHERAVERIRKEGEKAYSPGLPDVPTVAPYNPSRTIAGAGRQTAVLSGRTNSVPTFLAVSDATNQAAEIIRNLNAETIRLTATIDNPDELKAQIRAVKDQAEADLKVVMSTLREVIESTGDPAALEAFDEINRSVTEIKGKTEKVKSDFTAIASAGRSLISLAGVFGTISDDVQELARGIVDLVDNLGELKELDPNASAFQQAVPMVGIGAGALTALMALGNAFSNRGDAEERRLAREAQERMIEALDDNARRISSSIDQLLNSGIVGGRVTGAQAEQANALVQGFESQVFGMTGLMAQIAVARAGFRPTAGLESAVESLFTGLLDNLESLGIDALDIAAIRERYTDLLTGPASDRVQEIFSGDAFDNGIGLGDMIGQLFDDIGAASEGSVQGFIDRFNLLGQFLDESGGAAVRRFVDELLNSSVGISDGFREGLQSFLDGETSQSDFRAWLQELARQLAAGGATSLIGDVSADDFETLIDALEGMTRNADGGTTSNASSFRSITEVQADLVADLLRESNHYEMRAALAVEAMLDIMRGTVATTTPSGAPVTVNLTLNTTRTEMVRDAQRKVGQVLNEERIRQEQRLF